MTYEVLKYSSQISGYVIAEVAVVREKLVGSDVVVESSITTLETELPSPIVEPTIKDSTEGAIGR